MQRKHNNKKVYALIKLQNNKDHHRRNILLNY